MSDVILFKNLIKKINKNYRSRMNNSIFTQNVLSHSESLRFFGLSLTKNENETSDLIQETLLKAFSNEDKFKPDTNLKAWLFTIMKNVFINNYRRGTKVKTILDSGTDASYIFFTPSTKHAGADGLYVYNEIQNTVSQLDDEYRIPFRMYFEGYKYKEIADELRLPIGTVKSRIFLARKQLMHELADYRRA